jgi:hypothetical protein
VEPLPTWLPTIYRREFWAVQALVLLIAGGYALLETVRPTVEPPTLYLLPTSLYFVAVVHACQGPKRLDCPEVYHGKR